MKGKTFVLVFVVSLLFLMPFVVNAQEKVVLYSAHTQEIIDAMVPRFEEATGIKAEVIRLGSGDVVARVKAVFRRVHAEPEAHNLVVGSISLDDETRQVMIDKQVLNLTPNEFGLLKIMMTQPNRVFSRNELINRVQGYDFEGYDRTIATHIKNLRKKIAQKLPGQQIIRTVYGVGYKFSANP